jgi:hypothetical protein
MVSKTIVCLSGTDPIILGVNVCNQGFYCNYMFPRLVNSIAEVCRFRSK